MRKYPGQGTKTYTFQDGKEYEVPLWVARHLNGIDATAAGIRGKVNSCAYPVHHYQIDPQSGLSSVEVGTVRRRYGFQSRLHGGLKCLPTLCRSGVCFQT